MNLDIKKRIDLSNDPKGIRLFFNLLRTALQTASITSADPRIQINIRDDHYKRYFSAVVNSRLFLFLKAGQLMGLMLKESDWHKVETIPFEQKESFAKQEPKAVLVYYNYEVLEANLDILKSLWIDCFLEYYPMQVKSQYRNKNVPELYDITMDEDLLDQYMAPLDISAFKDTIDVKEDFLKWLISNDGGKSSYFSLQFASSEEKLRAELDKYADTYEEEFESKLFVVSRTASEYKLEEIKRDLYNDNSRFAKFSKEQSNHRPRAILGKKNYLKFLEEFFSQHKTSASEPIEEAKNIVALNQIFYGPPGTGKTYHTVLESAKIVSQNAALTYSEAKDIFKTNLGDQIEFITFHQNYSYEDFIQGLRPDTENGEGLTFKKKDGVFKRIAERALKNLTLAEKAPAELSNEARFDAALEIFKDHILDTEDKYDINDSVYIFDIDDEAFRYTGKNWVKHANGIRMKFSDLKEFYRRNVKTRKDIKALTTISGLANQHATYYLLVYEAILKHLPPKILEDVKVVRKNYVIVIDEINRANISRVFGELITLIEEDKRSHGEIPMQVTLPSGDKFIVPSNLYIIGTMNTADKSIALLDIALRRRFEFKPMYPQYEIDGREINHSRALRLINERICKLKNRDFQIGHAYFMERESLADIMNMKIIPLLLEYFMNNEEEVKRIITLEGSTIDTACWPMKFSLN